VKGPDDNTQQQRGPDILYTKRARAKDHDNNASVEKKLVTSTKLVMGEHTASSTVDSDEMVSTGNVISQHSLTITIHGDRAYH